jgi:hypothetical protein
VRPPDIADQAGGDNSIIAPVGVNNMDTIRGAVRDALRIR